MKKTFTKKIMLEILNDDSDYDTNVVSDEIVGHRRWSVDHELIFKFENKFYRTHYAVGATESQDEGPWEYETDVECVEVQAKEKTVVFYEAVKG